VKVLTAKNFAPAAPFTKAPIMPEDVVAYKALAPFVVLVDVQIE